MHFHSHSCRPSCDCHDPPSSHKIRQLWIALALISIFAVAELSVGLFSHSLALLAESGHMLSDALALGVALLATWMAQLPASNQATFGYRRVEILAALANGVGLLVVAGLIAWEAIARLQEPPTEILSLPMLITAVVGLGVNSLNAFLLHDDSHHDLNLQGAFLHMVADAVSSVGVIGAAIAVWLFHWNWADGAISLSVAVFIGIGTIPIIRQSCNILLEKTPPHLDVEQIQTHLQRFLGVKAVDRLHVWTIALGQEALFAELIVDIREGEERDRLLAEMQASVREKYGIQEIILQMTAPVTVNLSRPGILLGVISNEVI
jgi:cobalt-zinc-cadmium efflux system protein